MRCERRFDEREVGLCDRPAGGKERAIERRGARANPALKGEAALVPGNGSAFTALRNLDLNERMMM